MMKTTTLLTLEGCARAVAPISNTIGDRTMMVKTWWKGARPLRIYNGRFNASNVTWTEGQSRPRAIVPSLNLHNHQRTMFDTDRMQLQHHCGQHTTDSQTLL